MNKTITIKNWWVEPYTDCEDKSGFVITYLRDNGKKYYHGALYESALEASVIGTHVFGKEPDYSRIKQFCRKCNEQ